MRDLDTTPSPSQIAERFRRLDGRIRRGCADARDPERLAIRIQHYGDVAGQLLLVADAAGLFDDEELWAQIKRENLPGIRGRLAAPGQYAHVVFIGALHRWLARRWADRIDADPAALIHLYDTGPSERFYLMFWPHNGPRDREEQMAFKRGQADMYARACALLAELVDPSGAPPAMPDTDLAADDAWWGPLTKKALAEALGMSPSKFKRFSAGVGLIQESRSRWYIRMADLDDAQRAAVQGVKPLDQGGA